MLNANRAGKWLRAAANRRADACRFRDMVEPFWDSLAWMVEALRCAREASRTNSGPGPDSRSNRMSNTMFGLFGDSNFDAHDRDRFEPVLRAGLAEHDLGLEDVVFVHQSMGMWVFCRTGPFRADILGVFKKRTEIDRFIPVS